MNVVDKLLYKLHKVMSWIHSTAPSIEHTSNHCLTLWIMKNNNIHSGLPRAKIKFSAFSMYSSFFLCVFWHNNNIFHHHHHYPTGVHTTNNPLKTSINQQCNGAIMKSCLSSTGMSPNINSLQKPKCCHNPSISLILPPANEVCEGYFF